MKYYLFLDDSGQLHPNYPKSDYFVYGGLLLKEKDYHKINTAYKKLVRRIKQEKQHNGELKTCQMNKGTKRRLLQALAKYSCDQVFVCVKVPTLLRINFDKPKDVVRYKNYIVKRLVDKLITDGKIPKACTLLEIQIDNQNIAHSANDSLQDHLLYYFNENDYYYVHKVRDTTSFSCDFRVLFKDSATNYLIQAADLLANTKCKIVEGNNNLKKLLKEDYISLKLPDGVEY